VLGAAAVVDPSRLHEARGAGRARAWLSEPRVMRRAERGRSHEGAPRAPLRAGGEAGTALGAAGEAGALGGGIDVAVRIDPGGGARARVAELAAIDPRTAQHPKALERPERDAPPLAGPARTQRIAEPGAAGERGAAVDGHGARSAHRKRAARLPGDGLDRGALGVARIGVD